MLLSLASIPPIPATRMRQVAALPVARKVAPRAVLRRGSAAAAGGSAVVVAVAGDAAATEAERRGLACPLSSRPAPAVSNPFLTDFEKKRALPALAVCLAVLSATAGDPRGLLLLPAAALAAMTNALLPFVAFALVAVVAAVATVAANNAKNRNFTSRARAFATQRFLKLAPVVVFFTVVAKGILPARLFPWATSVVELRRLSAAIRSDSFSSSSSEPFIVVSVPSLVAELLLRSSSSSSNSNSMKMLLAAGNVLLSVALGVVCGVGAFFVYTAFHWIAWKVKQRAVVAQMIQQKEQEQEEERAVVKLLSPPLPPAKTALPPPPPPPPPTSESLESQLRREIHKSKQELSESRAQVKALAAELDLERRRRQKRPQREEEKADDDNGTAATALAAAAAAASSFAARAPRSSSQPLV